MFRIQTNLYLRPFWIFLNSCGVTHLRWVRRTTRALRNKALSGQWTSALILRYSGLVLNEWNIVTCVETSRTDFYFCQSSAVFCLEWCGCHGDVCSVSKAQLPVEAGCIVVSHCRLHIPHWSILSCAFYPPKPNRPNSKVFSHCTCFVK